MNDEQTGLISYKVEIDISAIKSGAKTAEEAITTSFDKSAKIADKSSKQMDNNFNNVAKSLTRLAASFLSLRAVTSVLGDSVDAANKYQASMLGLESVSSAFIGDTQGAMQAAKELSSDGLLPLSDAATGLKNLLAAGYGLEEATALMNAFKDSAAFGRQSSLGFGEAIRSATEGVKNGNSILVDNAGVTKNLSVILKEAGYSAQDLQRASTDVGVRMAILNGIIKETAAQTGDAAKLTETAAGADARLSFATDQLKVRIGGLANAIRKDAVSSLADFVGQNSDTVISLGAGVVAMAGFAMAVKGVSAAMTGLKVVMTAISAHPIIAILSVLAGITAAIATSVGLDSDAMKDMAGSSSEAEQEISRLRSTMMDTSEDTGSAASSINDLSKQLKKLSDQAEKTERDYIESLAKIVQEHQESVRSLTKQVEDENNSYTAAVRKRLTAFQEEQGKEEQEHFKKVTSIQNQLDFLLKHRNENNKQQISDLKFALAQENAQYQKQTQLQIEEFNAAEEAEKLSHQQRLDEHKSKLDEEIAFLNKHRDSVQQVRNVILLDEIESLRRSNAENKRSLEEQRAEAIAQNKATGASAGNAFASEYNKQIENQINEMKNKFKNAGEDSGKVFGDKWYEKFTEAGYKYARPLYQIGDWLAEMIYNGFSGKKSKYLKSVGESYSVGGFTGQGGVNEVAGAVHKGEYVIPQRLVDQSTGLPKAGALEAVTGSTTNNSNTYTINNDFSGVIASSPQEFRHFVDKVSKAQSEIMQQKNFKLVGGY